MPFTRYLFSILWVIFFSCFLISQNKSWTQQEIDKYLSGCESNLGGADFHAVLPCLDRIRPHLESTKYYGGLERYYAILIDYHMHNGSPEQMINSIEEALSKYGNHFSEKIKMRFSLSEMQILLEQNKSEEIFAKAEELFPKVKTGRFRASLHAIRASAYMNIGRYEESLKDFHKALSIFKSENDIENVIVIYSRIGLLQQQLEEYDKALEFLNMAYDYSVELGEEVNLALAHTNLGVIYLDIGNVDAAIENFLKARDFSKRTDNQIDEARLLLNLGDAYASKNDYKTALDYFDKSLQISKNQNIHLGILYNYRSLGRVFTELGEYKKAVTSLDSAMVYARKLKMPKLEADILLASYKLHRRMASYQQALDYYIQSDSLNNILLSEDKKKSIADLELKYQSELKKEELEKVQLELDNKRAQNKTLRIGIFSVLTAFGAVGFFMFYRNRNLRRLYDRNIELLQTVNYYKISPDTTDDREQLKKIFDRLMVLINQNKIYKDPYLSIKDVACKLETNEKYVSSAISKYANMNYNNFINFHRINEAKELIYSRETANMNEIMKASGFNSRTPFYNAFKNFTGLSPIQFKNMKHEVVS